MNYFENIGQVGTALFNEMCIRDSSYPLDKAKREGMELYLTWAAALEAAPVNLLKYN